MFWNPLSGDSSGMFLRGLLLSPSEAVDAPILLYGLGPVLSCGGADPAPATPAPSPSLTFTALTRSAAGAGT
ncbi:MAG: hypothetical protein WDW36_005400 [Sanguina aurantia]